MTISLNLIEAMALVQEARSEPEIRLVDMRCYFNLVNGPEKIIDHDGIEVRDIEQAWAQALKAIEELREEDAAEASDWADWCLEVTDESGRVLFSLGLETKLQ